MGTDSFLTKHKNNFRIRDTSPYFNLTNGTPVYQSADGTFLPDSQQPKPNRSNIYSFHTSTRYKNVVIGSNEIAKSYNPQNGELIDTNMHLPELYKAREECCGCSACYAICPVRNFLPNGGKDCIGRFGEKYSLPHGAIYMEDDEEGFQYPVVDAGLCIRCYKCIEVCPLK